MSLAQIDREQLTAAILAADVGGPAKEEAARLVEFYLEKLPTLPEVNWKVVAVESPFFIKLAPKFYCIGVMDAIFDDGNGFVQCEWKTKGAPKMTKEGLPYKGQDEVSWLDDIVNGPQLAIYALAGREGRFLYSDNHPMLASQEPRVLVRACVKSNPPMLWPQKWEDGVWSFPIEALEATKAALKVKCTQILAARKSGLTPWQLIGEQCENKYRRVCGLRDVVCRTHQHPAFRPLGTPMETHASDPRKRIYELLKLDPDDREIVMLSPSGYGQYTQCMELGRVNQECAVKGLEDASFELEVGGTYHVAVAEIYRQLQISA